MAIEGGRGGDRELWLFGRRASKHLEMMSLHFEGSGGAVCSAWNSQSSASRAAKCNSLVVVEGLGGVGVGVRGGCKAIGGPAYLSTAAKLNKHVEKRLRSSPAIRLPGRRSAGHSLNEGSCQKKSCDGRREIFFFFFTCPPPPPLFRKSLVLSGTS